MSKNQHTNVALFAQRSAHGQRTVVRPNCHFLDCENGHRHIGWTSRSRTTVVTERSTFHPLRHDRLAEPGRSQTWRGGPAGCLATTLPHHGAEGEHQDRSYLRDQHDHWPLCPQLASAARTVQTPPRTSTYCELDLYDRSRISQQSQDRRN